jgi:predicted hydrocarbon binding protein
MPVLIIPRELMIYTAEEISSSLLSFARRGMMGIYRMVSRKTDQRVFYMHMPPEAVGKKGIDLINAVFDLGWSRYQVTEVDENTHHVVSRCFWLSEALKGVDKKPICALMEGILGSLFSQAFDRKVEVNEIQCVAIGDEVDTFEVKIK